MVVDSTSLHGGSYHKSLMYANNFQEILYTYDFGTEILYRYDPGQPN